MMGMRFRLSAACALLLALAPGCSSGTKSKPVMQVDAGDAVSPEEVADAIAAPDAEDLAGAPDLADVPSPPDGADIPDVPSPPDGTDIPDVPSPPDAADVVEPPDGADAVDLPEPPDVADVAEEVLPDAAEDLEPGELVEDLAEDLADDAWDVVEDDATVPECSGIGADEECDDEDPCTVDACVMGAETFECAHVDLVCPDSEDPCLDAVCDAAAGGCVPVPGPDGTACDDGDLCTGNDLCTAGSCGGSPVDCDDADPCTIDQCDPLAGCTHDPATEVCGNGLDDDCDGAADCLDDDCFGEGCDELCTGGLDEDGDGLTDCDDPDCFAPGCPELCDDQLDNDGDGAVDCADPQCFGPPDCAVEALCQDSLDNDGDGAADCEDSDCFSDLCPELCGDTLDNDGDGQVDCADPDCPAGQESCEETESTCDDAFDNDGDGQKDCADSDCETDPVCGAEVCGDGVDNDGDGDADCADSDCPAGVAPCEEPESTCDDAFDNDGDGAQDCADSDCFGPACPEKCGGGFDEDGDGKTDCDDEDCFGPNCHELCSGGLDEDGDGKVDCDDPDCYGPFCPEVCDDTFDNDGDGLDDCEDPDCFGPACPEVCTGSYDEDDDGLVDCQDPDCWGATCAEECFGGLDEDGDGAVDCADDDCFGKVGCTVELLCDDGQDNDLDGKADCADSDCFGPGCPELCTGGLDEDGDGFIDCADDDCIGPTCPEQCANGVDDDGDELVDCADSDCFGPGCPELCTGGLDEDGDGKKDCGDPDCYGPGCWESCWGGADEDGDGFVDCADTECFGKAPYCVTEALCEDGKDNDKDGLVDCLDPDCASAACAEVCDDLADNDLDGHIDCADSDCFGPACPEACDDGLDNDGDGNVDCGDSDCFGPACAEVCTGGLDEDGDGKADCGDPDCYGPGCFETCWGGADEDGDGDVDCDDADCFGPECPEVCGDGLDNDGDGLVDCNDPDCVGPDCSEICNNAVDDDGDGDIDCDDLDCFGPECPEVCGDGLDNDGDGALDCADSDCFGPACPEVCDDGADNDGDGDVDCDDADCAAICGEICDDGVDNDGDGDVDCQDTDCDGVPACLGNACAAPIVVAETGTWEVDSVPLSDTLTLSCGQPGGTDVVFLLELAQPADLHLDTDGSDHDTVLAVFVGSCGIGADVGCNDDVDFRHDWSRIDWNDAPAGSYYIVVDQAPDVEPGTVVLNVVVGPTALPPGPTVDADPLVRMPGTQENAGINLEAPNKCLNCHSGYDPAVEPGTSWLGGMMAQASRDFLFWATLTVAIQDSYWVIGRPNGTDLCMRCHFPAGWVAGRSEPTHAGAMLGADWDGVSCDVCHRMFDPHYEDTWAGTREGNDWTGYWDESGQSATPSQVAANQTRQADIGESAGITLFNGKPFYGNDNRPVEGGWTEANSGQYFLAAQNTKRASFADAEAKHKQYYSRFHKSKYMCGTCHDVSNSALANFAFKDAQPGVGDTVLPSESQPANSYFHVERTFSEFMLSKYGQEGGAPGSGAFAPDQLVTSLPGNFIGKCQDCHMADTVGVAANKQGIPVRPDDSVEHPKSGLPMHDMVGGNAFVTSVLASSVLGSPNYDATNAALLNQGPTVLTLDLLQGEGLDPAALIEGSARAIAQLERAASIQDAAYNPQSGALAFKVVNHTGHKLISGYGEGRRMFLNVKLYAGNGLLAEINPYDVEAGTLRGLPEEYSPDSPPLQVGESYRSDLVYEMHLASSLTGETETFHFLLGTSRHKDNRIPPAGFDIDAAPARLCEPVKDGQPAPDLFTAAEYLGGYDAVALDVAPGADRVEIRLFYQTTTREYVEFLRNEINGTASTLGSPTPAGAAIAYIAQEEPFFDAIRAWGNTIWQLWEHNKERPGAAPVLMTESILEL